MPRHKWIPLVDIYALVQGRLKLDREDQDPQAPNSTIPKWKRNVRNVLQYQKANGGIVWDGQGNYRL